MTTATDSSLNDTETRAIDNIFAQMIGTITRLFAEIESKRSNNCQLQSKITKLKLLLEGTKMKHKIELFSCTSRWKTVVWVKILIVLMKQSHHGLCNWIYISIFNCLDTYNSSLMIFIYGATSKEQCVTDDTPIFEWCKYLLF